MQLMFEASGLDPEQTLRPNFVVLFLDVQESKQDLSSQGIPFVWYYDRTDRRDRTSRNSGIMEYIECISINGCADEVVECLCEWYYMALL